MSKRIDWRKRGVGGLPLRYSRRVNQSGSEAHDRSLRLLSGLSESEVGALLELLAEKQDRARQALVQALTYVDEARSLVPTDERLSQARRLLMSAKRSLRSAPK